MKTLQIIGGIVTNVWSSDSVFGEPDRILVDDNVIVNKGDVVLDDDSYYTLKQYESYVDGEIATDINLLKDSKNSEVKAQYTEHINVNYDYNEFTFEADANSRIEISKTTQFANSAVNGLSTWADKNTWKDINGVRQTFNTPQEFIAFSEGIFLRTENNLLNSDSLKDQIDALDDVDAIKALDITQGWTYE